MKRYRLGAVLGILILALPADAFAFCGVIEEHATASTADRAIQKAERQVRRQVKQLSWQHRNKLVLSDKSSSCVGGALAIDANGQQIEGKPSCTITQPFCVNP
jgi:hypothetical protein